MKTVFASLLFTLVSTSSIAQVSKPLDYDWSHFNEQSYQDYKKELIQYYDSKKEEVIQEYSSGFKSTYPDWKISDLELLELERQRDMEDLEFNYKWSTRTQLEKTIDSIKVFLNSNKFRYGIAPIILGLLIGYLIRIFKTSAGVVLQKNFQSLGNMKGMKKSDIIKKCGNFNSIEYIENGTICQWSTTNYSISLIFNQNDEMVKIGGESTI